MEMGEGKDEGKGGMKHKREEIITSQAFIMIAVVFRFLLHILSLGHFSECFYAYPLTVCF